MAGVLQGCRIMPHKCASRPDGDHRRIRHSPVTKLLARARIEWLPAATTEAILQAYGIPFVPSRLVSTPCDAVSAAYELDRPVVLKAEAMIEIIVGVAVNGRIQVEV